LKAEVENALAEIAAGMPGKKLESKEDDSGGAVALVHDLAIGSSFDPSTSWIGFHVTFAYPDADVYPHFLGPEIRYVGDGDAPNQHPDGNLPTAMTRGASLALFDLPAIQVSRRSNRRDAGTDSALQKLLRVLDFLRSR